MRLCLTFPDSAMFSSMNITFSKFHVGTIAACHAHSCLKQGAAHSVSSAAGFLAMLSCLYACQSASFLLIEGEDKRTTLMIKNIPNKYTQKMLLTTIDEKFRGTYDFFYLPIDFKNKCNVGYAFINMVRPEYIVPLVQKLDRKKWEKFNSEKVCNISYARIQVLLYTCICYLENLIMSVALWTKGA